LSKAAAGKHAQKAAAAGTLKKLDNNEHKQMNTKQIKEQEHSAESKQDALKVHKMK
jgi:hypothetical protein